MRGEDRRARNILRAGIVALAIALGIGRFAYTPLLPLMQRNIHFGDDFAGLLASANYAGYLIGALWAAWRVKRGDRLKRLRVNLVLTIVTTLGMGLTDHRGIWIGLRFFSGASSAMVFVLASGVVLEALAKLRRSSWAGWLYAGVGVGISLSALLIPVLDGLAGWRGGWIGLAGSSVLLALEFRRSITDGVFSDRPEHVQEQPGSLSGPFGMLPWLTVAYFCEGLGYIVTGTFLVAWLQRTSAPEQTGLLAWLVVGLAAIPSCVLWMKAGLRLGLAATLIFAHLVQAVGILLPVLAPSLWGAIGGAAFFGGTFLGIAALSLVLGRTLAPQQADRVVAVLTAAFGAGQMLGPAIAGLLATHAGNFTSALIGAAGIVALGAVFLLIGLAWKGANVGPRVAEGCKSERS